MSRFTGYVIFAHRTGIEKPVLVDKFVPADSTEFTIRKVEWYSTDTNTDPDTREVWTNDGDPLWGPYFATEQSIYVTKMNAHIALDTRLKYMEQFFREELQQQIARVTPLIDFWVKMVENNQKNLK